MSNFKIWKVSYMIRTMETNMKNKISGNFRLKLFIKAPEILWQPK